MREKDRKLMPNSWVREWTNICDVLGRYVGWDKCKLTTDKAKLYKAKWEYQRVHNQ